MTVKTLALIYEHYAYVAVSLLCESCFGAVFHYFPAGFDNVANEVYKFVTDFDWCCLTKAAEVRDRGTTKKTSGYDSIRLILHRWGFQIN